MVHVFTWSVNSNGARPSINQIRSTTNHGTNSQFKINIRNKYSCLYHTVITIIYVQELQQERTFTLKNFAPEIWSNVKILGRVFFIFTLQEN